MSPKRQNSTQSSKGTSRLCFPKFSAGRRYHRPSCRRWTMPAAPPPEIRPVTRFSASSSAVSAASSWPGGFSLPFAEDFAVPALPVGTYKGNAKLGQAHVTSYRYPENPSGSGVATSLPGPEQVFRVVLSKRVANFGVRLALTLSANRAMY